MKRAPQVRKQALDKSLGAVVTPLLAELRELILTAREQVVRAVNTGLVMLYWQVGDRIRREILREKRAAYGEQIVSSLATQLASEFGRGFSHRNLFNMIRFAEVFPNFEIVQALTAQLSWTHFTLLLPLQDPLKRDFYAEMARIERWSTRTLEKKIQSMLYERTALSRKPEALIRQELEVLRAEDKLTHQIWFSATRISSISWALRTPTPKRILKPLFCERSSLFCLNSARDLPLLNAKNASPWTVTTTIWICSSTIVRYGG